MKLWKKALLYASSITVFQIILLLGSSAAPTFKAQYEKIYQWDSYWYGTIASEGYFAKNFNGQEYLESNVAFFPGYPLFIRIIQTLFQIQDVRISAGIASQLCTVGFWYYILLLFFEWNLSPSLIIFGVLWIVCHPAAFFMVAPYSESLFLMMLMGFIYWDKKPGKLAWVLTLIHGYVATATRIIGALCTLGYSFSQLIIRRNTLKKAAITSFITTLGGMSLFIYAYLKWNSWTLFFQTEKRGWGVYPNYFAFFDPGIYRLFMPNWDDPNSISALSVPIIIYSTVFVILLELILLKKSKTDWKDRIGFYACLIPMIYITICGRISVYFMSMLRYHLPIHILLILPLLHYFHKIRLPNSLTLKLATRITSALIWIALLYLQLQLASRYVRGLWVA